MSNLFPGTRDAVHCTEQENNLQEAFKILLKHLLQQDDTGWIDGLKKQLRNNGKWSDTFYMLKHMLTMIIEFIICTKYRGLLH